MSISKILIGYVLTFIVFFAVDMLWLGVLAKGIYKKYLGDFMSSTINWPAAIIFYLLFVAGVLIFVVFPSVNKGSIGNAILLGALFGLITYATYDLTNYATLKDWPIQIVFIDLAWGAILSMIVSSAGYYIIKFLK